jgi:hypothetical protein
VIEPCYGPPALRPSYYRVHFRSFIHMLNCTGSYVEYERNDNGTLKYTDETKMTRVIEQCYAIPLIFDLNRTVVYDPMDK